jgi:membrane-associated protein
VLDPDLASLSAVAVYAIVWGFLFAECGLLLGFLLPGDTILFGAGLLAAAPGSGVDIVVLVVGAFIAAVAGNEVGYRTGRRFGRAWVEARENGRALEQLRRTERFYDRYGWFSVVVARWIPWVRTFLPIVGYYAYRFPTLRTIAFTIAGIFITISLVGLAVMLVRDGLRRRRERATTAGGQDAPGDLPGD